MRGAYEAPPDEPRDTGRPIEDGARDGARPPTRPPDRAASAFIGANATAAARTVAMTDCGWAQRGAAIDTVARVVAPTGAVGATKASATEPRREKIAVIAC